MLIYLDAMIVQYCADYEGFLFRGELLPARNKPLVRELQALQKLIELEQFGHWEFAASGHLLDELHRGRPSQCQLEAYDVLADAATTSEPADVERFIDQVRCLGLQRADERHLAIAAAMKASWFITNDQEIFRKVAEEFGGFIGSMQVDTPARCIDRIFKGFFLV